MDQGEREAKKAAMDTAGKVALEYHQKMFSEGSPEFQDGMLFVASWIEANYRAAGYKRLCRGLLSWLKERKT